MCCSGRPVAAIDVPVGSVVAVEGTVTSYRGARRIALTKMGPAEEWDLAELVTRSPRSTDELVAEFTKRGRICGSTEA